MNLFDPTALFDEGKKRHTDFKLPDTELKLWDQYFPKSVSDHYFQTLLVTTPWKQHIRKMYDKLVPDPRLIARYGGSDGLEWTDTLLDIKSKVEETMCITFNRVLLNYYRDGNDSVAWHSDTLPSDGKHHHIASVTFGETRLFKVRRKGSKDNQVSIPLTHGSLLLMGETMQLYYEHHVPKTTRKIGARINLTFRISEKSNSLEEKVKRDF
jgi:alkylated DNA repair dioxygenase AlkB